MLRISCWLSGGRIYERSPPNVFTWEILCCPPGRTSGWVTCMNNVGRSPRGASAVGMHNNVSALTAITAASSCAVNKGRKILVWHLCVLPMALLFDCDPEHIMVHDWYFGFQCILIIGALFLVFPQLLWLDRSQSYYKFTTVKLNLILWRLIENIFRKCTILSFWAFQTNIMHNHLQYNCP